MFPVRPPRWRHAAAVRTSQTPCVLRSGKPETIRGRRPVRLPVHAPPRDRAGCRTRGQRHQSHDSDLWPGSLRKDAHPGGVYQTLRKELYAVRKKGIPKMELKKRTTGKFINGKNQTPWKIHNPNCDTCMYRNHKREWAKMGTCNYAGITGKPRITICKAKDCPGFPGKRITNKKGNTLDE